jgi:hypothetical protein
VGVISLCVHVERGIECLIKNGKLLIAFSSYLARRPFIVSHVSSMFDSSQEEAAGSSS